MNIIIEKCNGIILQGPRKDTQCTRDDSGNGYCSIHQRHYEYEQIKLHNSIPCSMFFRGCNIQITSEQNDKNIKTCDSCRAKKNPKKVSCSHDKCKFNIIHESQKYCKKHIRDFVKDDEKMRNILYCDINRGCFNIVKDGESKCNACINILTVSITSDIAILRKKYDTIPIPICDNYMELHKKQEKNYIEIHEHWRTIQRGAISRSILFTITLDEFERLIIQPCYYCGFISTIRINGIDRVNNNKGYILSNCLPCCTLCNIMKQAQSPGEFLDKVAAISLYIVAGTPILDTTIEKWKSVYCSNKTQYTYNQYKYNAIHIRNLEFNLSELQFNSLRNLSCYLCGISTSKYHMNGIDRVSSEIREYTIGNCRTCCTHCNIMKGNIPYADIIGKCHQIKDYNCDQSLFIGISREVRNILRNEFYTANDIYTFMITSRMTDYMDWCKDKGKTVEYITDITEIYKTYTDKDITVVQIKRALDKERNHNAHSSDEKQHYHSSAIYAMLTHGQANKFKEWYETRYTPSQSFNEQYIQLQISLDGVQQKKGIELCKKFMISEKYRRNNQKLRDIQPKHYINPIVIPENKEPSKNIVHAVLKSLTPLPVIQEPSVTKQWKVKQIYEHFQANNIHLYKAWCESTHQFAEGQWTQMWTEFIGSLHSTTYEIAEQIIRTFIESLRKLRHTILSDAQNYRKNPLERSDRQQWPAVSVLRAYKEGKMTLFKEFQDKYTGDDPCSSTKRWQVFTQSLDTAIDDTIRKSIISKFMAAQRARVYRKQ